MNWIQFVQILFFCTQCSVLQNINLNVMQISGAQGSVEWFFSSLDFFNFDLNKLKVHRLRLRIILLLPYRLKKKKIYKSNINILNLAKKSNILIQRDIFFSLRFDAGEKLIAREEKKDNHKNKLLVFPSTGGDKKHANKSPSRYDEPTRQYIH